MTRMNRALFALLVACRQGPETNPVKWHCEMDGNRSVPTMCALECPTMRCFMREMASCAIIKGLPTCYAERGGCERSLELMQEVGYADAEAQCEWMRADEALGQLTTDGRGLHPQP